MDNQAELVVKLFRQGCRWATYNGRVITKFYDGIHVKDDSEYLIRWAEWTDATKWNGEGWLYKYKVTTKIPTNCEVIGVLSADRITNSTLDSSSYYRISLSMR